MRYLNVLCLRVRSLLRRDNVDQELDRELRLHLEEQIQENVAAGMTPEEARLAALRLIGNMTHLREQCRDARGLNIVFDVVQDCRHTLRMLRRNAGFAAVVVFSLALGIGTTTAILTLAESVLWKPIPVKNPEQLRMLWWHGRDSYGLNIDSSSPTFGRFHDHPTEDDGMAHSAFTYPIYLELQRANTVFESLFAIKEIGRLTAIVEGNAEAVNCFLVSGGFYRGMEIAPALGRGIAPEDDLPGANAVAVISHDYWTRRFGRDPQIIGKRIAINQIPITIVGVNPADFTGIAPGANFDIWAPLLLQPRLSERRSLIDSRDGWWLSIMGRLKEGVDDEQARSALDLIFQQQVDFHFPGMRTAEQPRLRVESGARGMDFLTSQYSQSLIVLLCLAGLVLLIACVNVANLLLSKSAVRQREISLRLALGAGRTRIVRQMLAEGLLLACLAGIGGIVLGYWTRNIIPALIATSWRPNPIEAAFDIRVLFITVGVTIFTGVLFSLAPAWRAGRLSLNEALKDGSRGTSGLSKLRMGSVFVVLQVATSVLLLVAAGLFLQTFGNLKGKPIGFDAESILLFRLDLPRRYSLDAARQLFAAFQERIESSAAVHSATFSSDALLSRSSSAGRVTPIGPAPVLRKPSVQPTTAVGDRFFETMGIPILYGRALDERDDRRDASALGTAVVNRAFARHFFQEDDPVGRIFSEQRGATTPYEIVGVSADALFGDVRDPLQPTYYTYFKQQPQRGAVFAVRVANDDEGVIREIRQMLRSLDAELLITDVHTQMEEIQNTFSLERLLASLAAVFAAMALILACVGISGLMATPLHAERTRSASGWHWGPAGPRHVDGSARDSAACCRRYRHRHSVCAGVQPLRSRISVRFGTE